MWVMVTKEGVFLTSISLTGKLLSGLLLSGSLISLVQLVATREGPHLISSPLGLGAQKMSQFWLLWTVSHLLTRSGPPTCPSHETMLFYRVFCCYTFLPSQPNSFLLLSLAKYKVLQAHCLRLRLRIRYWYPFLWQPLLVCLLYLAWPLGERQFLPSPNLSLRTLHSWERFQFDSSS